jgi:CHASE3 domain sensor protein
MSPAKKASLTLAVALILLCFSAAAAAFTIVGLYDAETWVSHTYSVEIALGDLESSLADVGRHRIAYLDTGGAQDLIDFNAAAARIPAASP